MENSNNNNNGAESETINNIENDVNRNNLTAGTPSSSSSTSTASSSSSLNNTPTSAHKTKPVLKKKDVVDIQTALYTLGKSKYKNIATKIPQAPPAEMQQTPNGLLKGKNKIIKWTKRHSREQDDAVPLDEKDNNNNNEEDDVDLTISQIFQYNSKDNTDTFNENDAGGEAPPAAAPTCGYTSYDSDDSDFGDLGDLPTCPSSPLPAATVVTIGRNSFLYKSLNSSLSRGWDKSTDMIMLASQQQLKQMKQQLYYMGLTCPFLDVDKVIPTFSKFHAELGSHTNQKSTTNITYPMLVSTYMYCKRRPGVEETGTYLGEFDTTIAISKPNALNKYTDKSAFSNEIMGGIEQIIARQLNLPPTPETLLEAEEGVKEPSPTSAESPGTLKKHWLKRRFKKKESR